MGRWSRASWRERWLIGRRPFNDERDALDGREGECGLGNEHLSCRPALEQKPFREEADCPAFRIVK
jgi:hypothetical protein